MGFGRKRSTAVREVESEDADKLPIEFDKKMVEAAEKTPNFLKRPFGRFKGLTRDNTVICTPGMPYAWGFTYTTPYRYSFVKKSADFDYGKMEFDYMASSIVRGIRQLKHEMSMLSFIKNPIFSRRQRALQPLDD